jgi:hypothetical protein
VNVRNLSGRRKSTHRLTGTALRIINKLTNMEGDHLYFSVYLECSACRFNWGELIKREHRGHPIDCVKCGAEGTAHEKITAPNCMGIATKGGLDVGAYPDGMRAKSDDWKKMKEVADLQVQAAKTPFKKRGEISKEIKKITRKD